MDSKSIIFDIRSMMEHSKCSIKDAYAMCCSNLFLKRYKKNLVDISCFFSNFKEIQEKLEGNYEIIIVVTQSNDDYLNILKEYFDKNNKSYSVYGFEEFSENFSDKTSVEVQFESEKKRAKTPSPYSPKKNFCEFSEIIPDLFLSGVEGTSLIEDKHIHNVLSVMKNAPVLNSDINHLKLEIDDTHGQEIQNYFQEAHQFIDKALSNNEKVLVHCKAGISRSATIVISYIMKTKKMKLSDALAFVKSKRGIVDPNIDFIGSLMQYEKQNFVD